MGSRITNKRIEEYTKDLQDFIHSPQRRIWRPHPRKERRRMIRKMKISRLLIVNLFNTQRTIS